MEKKTVKSSVLKSGRRTFFFDVKVASNDKHYLKITQSRIDGEGETKTIKRNSFVLFQEDIPNFQSTLNGVVEYLHF